ncbi:DUF6059 family protein [Streptomyces asoensis]|uniref:DUF6059 family protein n=1 Tax=Streptomyces asoensis TaxID=249586 RepID=UPI0036743629
MIRVLRGGLRLIERWLRSAGRALATLGAVYVGPEALQAIDTTPAPSRSTRRLVRYTQARFRVLPPGVGGPPPAHPERLRGDAPLSPQEELLARELWPAYTPTRDAG